jgi:hypothetical protein
MKCSRENKLAKKLPTLLSILYSKQMGNSKYQIKYSVSCRMVSTLVEKNVLGERDGEGMEEG